MAVPLATQTIVVSSAMPVALHARARPVIEGVAQPRIAPIAHADADLLPALAGHRGNAAMGAQRLVVSFDQGPGGLGEDRGGDDSPHARQGPEDGHVTGVSGIAGLAEFVQEGIDPGADRGLRLHRGVLHTTPHRRHPRWTPNRP